MFRGTQTGNVDAKGRLKPSAHVQRRLKEEYESGDVFITTVDGVTVSIFPIKEWEAVEARLADKPTDGKQEMNGALKNKILFQANRFGAESALDNQGRFLVPALLRDTAGMRGEVKIQWQSNRLVVFNAENFERAAIENKLSTDELGRAADFGI